MHSARPQHAIEEDEEAPTQPIFERGLPFERGRLEHDAGDEVTVPLPELERDRAAHRVAHGDHRAPGHEEAHRRGRVVGARLEGELLLAADAAPVPAVIDGDHRVPLAQHLVDRAPLQVGAGRPPVEQEEHRSVRRAFVRADEGLSATLEREDEPRRDPGRRQRRPPRTRIEPAHHAARSRHLTTHGSPSISRTRCAAAEEIEPVIVHLEAVVKSDSTERGVE